MNPLAFVLAAGYGYLVGNQKARGIVFGQLRKWGGMAIDSIDKRGEPDVPPQESEQPTD